MPKFFSSKYFVLGCLIILSWSCQEKNTYLNHEKSATYVGKNTCKSCHLDKFESFMQTGMGQSFERASKHKSAAFFNEKAIVYDSILDLYYKPFWVEDTFKVLEYRLLRGDTVHKRIEKIDYIIGSGQHTNSHILMQNGYLHQVPVTFYTQKQMWDLPPGFEHGNNSRFDRKIGLECMACHNSFPNFVLGSENKYTSVPEGVGCESCHGPGSVHVKQKLAGNMVDTSQVIDYSIVNPGKLNIDLQFDVCQRCHLQGNTVLKDGKSFFDFKPGMRLSDYMTTFLPRYEHAENEFIMASHADRLKQSRCFIETGKHETKESLRPYKNGLTCVSCHNPHVSVKHTDNSKFNQTCKNCHNQAKKNECLEKTELRKIKNDNCVSCHMPKSGSTDIPHVSVHDHKIQRPIQQTEIQQIKKFIQLVAVNEKNPSNQMRAKAYIQQYEKFEKNVIYLDSAQYYLKENGLAERKENVILLVHLHFLRQDYPAIRALVTTLGIEYLLKERLNQASWVNEHAWTCYRIGEAFVQVQDKKNAIQFYKQATILSPYNLEFQNKYGVSLIENQKIDEGIQVFKKILQEFPKNVQALNNLGFTYMLERQKSDAKICYDQALILSPDYEPLLLNLAGYYNYDKNPVKAKYFLERVLKKNPNHKQAQELLKML